MAEFHLVLPDGRHVITSSPAAAIRLRYGSGAKEAPRTQKVAKAVETAKAKSGSDNPVKTAEKPAAKK